MKYNLIISLFWGIAFWSACGNNQQESLDFKLFTPEKFGLNESALVEEEDHRVLWQKPNTVLTELGDLTGKTIADLGAGTGFFSFRMLPRAGKVIALEIDTLMIAFMQTTKSRLSEELSRKLEIRLVKPDDPGLERGEVDYILIVNTVAYLTDRSSYFQKLKDGLKKDGKIVVVDFKKKQSEIGPEETYKLEDQVVADQLKAVGFTDVEIDNTTLDYQYIITAEFKN